jgi:hypothetical protein
MRARWFVPIGLVLVVLRGSRDNPASADIDYYEQPRNRKDWRNYNEYPAFKLHIPANPIVPKIPDIPASGDQFDFDDYANRHGYDDAYDKSDYSGK